MPKIKLIRLEEGDDFYTEDHRDDLVEDGILTPLEAAFMKGWDEAE